jgi:hypothetical protein
MMTIPTTNLFKGDRVKLSKTYIASQEIMGTGNMDKCRNRIGTIVSDTLKPQNHYIKVHWDGNIKANGKDVYMPDDLILYEEEEHAAA